MFSWLRRNRDDFYKPKERCIYRYHDGQKVVSADPLLLYKKVMEKGAELNVDIELSRSQHKDARKGHDNMVAKMRWVFDVKPLAEGGLTEQECIDLFDHFMTFCDDLKKNSPPPPISPTATSGPFGPSSGESPPTTNSSGSGSTGGEPSTEQPEQPPTEPESPSEP